MNTVAIVHGFQCRDCGHSWTCRFSDRLPVRPRCSKCKATRVRESPIAMHGASLPPDVETHDQTIERLVRAIRDILTTNDYCAIGRNLEGRFVAITPMMLKLWQSVADRYGEVVISPVTRATPVEIIRFRLFPMMKVG